MAEYIEREALLKQIDDYFDRTDPSGEEQIGVLQCRRIAREHTAADVVEVVRCGKCKWSVPCREGLGCVNSTGGLTQNLLGDNDFCSGGERRSE